MTNLIKRSILYQTPAALITVATYSKAVTFESGFSVTEFPLI